MRALPFSCLLIASTGLLAQDPFLVRPYLQLGERPSPERMELLWQTEDRDGTWTVEVRGPKGWREAAAPASTPIQLAGLGPHRVWRAQLDRLPPGHFQYRVKQAGAVVFEAAGRPLPAPKAPLRAVVFGDTGQGTPEQAAVAAQAHAQKPDLVVIPGDIVYGRGRASEYRERFFPFYASPAAPLLGSVAFAAAPGNHDIPIQGINKVPDGLAYFYYWSMPLNGPDSAGARPPVEATAMAPVLEAAGPRFPRMANFSFDAGPVHWTVLDSNPYVDWRRPDLQAWLEADLRAAKAPWRFVVFHHPGFNASTAHAGDQRMRLLSPIFERNGVQVVFAGHVHNYQRSKPLRFKPDPDAAQAVVDRKGAVPGAFTYDEAFDGRRRTRAKGVVYVVSGAGGAELYDPEQGQDKTRWKPWTSAFVTDRHSLTVLDVSARKLVLRQVDAAGKSLDQMVLTR